jgi:hypothetical protein
MMEHQGVDQVEDLKLPEGSATMDTWQMAQSVALPRSVEHRDLDPDSPRHKVHAAKQVGSDSLVVDPGSAGYMPTPKGERNLNKSEAQHAIFNEVNNLAAGEITRRARERGRNVGAGMPIIPVQSSTWTGYRMEGEKDPHYDARMSAYNHEVVRSTRETMRGAGQGWKAKDRVEGAHGSPELGSPLVQPGENVPMFTGPEHRQVEYQLDRSGGWKGKRGAPL